MSYQFPPDVDQLVKEQMGLGQYSSEDDLLRDALKNFSDYRATIADVLESLEDDRAGRVQSLQEVDAELRGKYKLPSRASRE